MGYPMSYKRVVNRWRLTGGYEYAKRAEYGSPFEDARALQRAVAGDLRRLEQDQRDLAHLSAYARTAGITTDQARAVLDALFGDRPLTWTDDDDKLIPSPWNGDWRSQP